ncbi:hypothetical protein CXB51_028432 [Gossypium anomalum]|uniref:Gag-pol polyprotein n=1 Tax=Gossypium anomalum TaxID=47600 RepID=A0A8J5Y775_9ROSI|nr:hypothetical protein CXB51_028432 [Gossypium anomalum]
MASLKYEIPLLDRNTRFALWQIKMQAVLAQMDLEDALLGIDKMPSTLTDEEKKHKDRKEGASVHEHLTVFKEILSNLEAIEVQYDKEDLGLILLCSLPPSYTTFRDTILYSRESLTVDEVYDSLTSTQEQNLRGKPKGSSKFSNRGRTCNFCKTKGHIKSECYKLQNKIKREAANQKGKQPENSGEADVVEDYSDGELLVASVNDSKVSEEWILDLGCIFHMIPIGIGVGTIKVKMFDGVVRTLSDVLHVPELKRNLISLSTLDSKGYRHTAESGVLKISKGSLVVMKGQRKIAKLYVLQGSTVTGDAAVASSSLSDDDITKLWHMCLGHMSENGMVELSKRGLLDGQGICKLNFCEHCVFGKQKRVRFTRGIDNTKGTLEYIHSDLWGPSRVPSRGGANYMLTFIDYFSRKIVQVRRDHETLDSSSYFTAKRRCGTNEQNDHGEAPSVAIEKKTPQEVWSGNPVNYSDLKIFGCPVDVVFNETTMLPNLSLKDSSNKENQKQVEHQINTESTPQAITKIENRVTSSPQYSIAKNINRREIKPLKKYAKADLVAYALNVAEDIDANQEPSNYSEAVSCEDSEKWMFAMQEEMESLYKNRTWDLVKLPKGKKVVRCKWVFKKKERTPGVEEPRYKARLVAKGYSQIPRVDFTDMFSPVVKHSSIRALLGIVAMHDLELEQLDVKTAFLHGELEDDIYM